MPGRTTEVSPTAGDVEENNGMTMTPNDVETPESGGWESPSLPSVAPSYEPPRVGLTRSGGQIDYAA